MRFTQRAVCLTAVAITSLAPIATAAAASASLAPGTAHGANGCVAVIATIPVGNGPGGIAVDRTTGTIYVANDGSNTVSVISARTGTVTATIPVGRSPQGVAVDARTDTIYAVSYTHLTLPTN